MVKNSLDILNGSSAYGYARREDQAGNATNNSSFYVELSENDYVQLMYRKESTVVGNAYSIPNESIISFEWVSERSSTYNGELLDTTGQYGNIALIGTNDLTIESYSASGTYYLDIPASAFDGYIYPTMLINDASSQRVYRGVWISPRNVNTDQWLQVDFGKLVNISGFRIAIYHGHQGRLPKDIIIQTSNDGVTFVDQEFLTLDNVADQVINLSSEVQAQYFRLFMKNNYGDKHIEIDEFEIFQ